MRIAVVGAGIVGVTTAYELACDGHAVSVFERCGSVAAETSFANAGVVAPGYVTPWAAPGMPRKVLGQWFARHAAVRIGRGALRPSHLAWLWRWWRACRPAVHRANRARLQRLAHFSRDRLHETTRALRLDYERAQGLLVLLRGPQDLALAKPGLALLGAGGTRFELLDAAGCRAVEPWLNPDQPLHAGIHLPDDEVGNCRQFAYLLRGEAQARGAEFHFHTVVQAIGAGDRPTLTHVYRPPDETARAETEHPDPHSTLPLEGEQRTDGFDAVVVCAAVESTALLHPLGIRLPLIPVHGYSITAPLRQDVNHPDRGPRAGLMDERYKVAISRLGSRVRVAGSAELGHAPTRMNPRALDTLFKVLNDWFPGAARLGQAVTWKGARPMLPDGPPVLGASGVPGVWLNLGHGSSGWALACGSARLVADAIAGRPNAIEIDGLGIRRLQA